LKGNSGLLVFASGRRNAHYGTKYKRGRFIKSKEEKMQSKNIYEEKIFSKWITNILAA